MNFFSAMTSQKFGTANSLKIKINYKLLKQFNPWLRAYSLPDKSRKKYVLKIPTDTDLLISEDLENVIDSAE